MSLREVLIFGGFSAEGDYQTNGRVLMIDNDDKGGSHLFLESTIDLQNGDLFTSTTTYNQAAPEEAKFFIGANYAHALTLGPERKFVTVFGV